MPFEYLEDLTVADVAFRAEGETLEEVFTAAWEATLRVLIELPLDREPSGGRHPGRLRPRVRRRIRLREQALDYLLHALLEEQLYLKDVEGLLLGLESCRIDRRGQRWQVRATAVGEAADPSRHQLGTDVKAVTWHRFSLRREHGRWRATVVLDV